MPNTIEKIERMNCLRYKLGIIGLLFFSFFQNVIGQEKKGYFAEQIIIGTSISRIQDFGNNNPEFIHNEYSWVSNAAISLTKRIHLGFEYKFIRTTGSTTLNSRKPLNFNMYGLFSQIDILESKKDLALIIEFMNLFHLMQLFSIVT